MAEMTPRERWLALLNGEQADRVPTDYWTTGEFDQKLMRHLGVSDRESLYRKLHIDAPCSVGPAYRPSNPPPEGEDMWGSRRVAVDYGTGRYMEVCHHPWAEIEDPAELDHVRAPSPEDFDYSGIPDQLAANAGHRIVCGLQYEPFLLYCHLRGLEQGFEDLLIHPEIVERGLGILFDFFYEQNRRVLEAADGGIDLLYLAEDLGSQTGPLMSLDCYRRFIRPNQEKMAELARSHGVHVFYHTDGAARIYLGDLIDVVGIEILNPIQWRCPGMEREGLVADFGDKVVFHGSIDNQHTLPFGSVDDVVAEVRESVEIYRPARWICAPCHNIQPNTSPENVVAMYETIRELGG